MNLEYPASGETREARGEEQGMQTVVLCPEVLLPVGRPPLQSRLKSAFLRDPVLTKITGMFPAPARGACVCVRVSVLNETHRAVCCSGCVVCSPLLLRQPVCQLQTYPGTDRRTDSQRRCRAVGLHACTRTRMFPRRHLRVSVQKGCVAHVSARACVPA